MFGAGAVLTRTALVVFGSIDLSSVIAAALEGLRLATLLAVFGAFNAVVDPFGLVRLAPRRWHEPALAVALALSLAPRFIDAAGRVREAQKMRGLRTKGIRSLRSLVVPVLATGMEEAVTLAESMDARGHGRGGRTLYRPPRWDLRSGLCVLLSGIAAGVFLALAAAGRGEASYSPFPLTWPSASGVMVAAALLLAGPALLAPRRDEVSGPEAGLP